MTTTNITQARSNLFKLTEQVIKLNDVVNINTKNGNVIMMSEEDYQSMMETIYLNGIPGVADSVCAEMSAPRDELKEIDWRKELQ